jgi:hypothetical protein
MGMLSESSFELQAPIQPSHFQASSANREDGWLFGNSQRQANQAASPHNGFTFGLPSSIQSDRRHVSPENRENERTHKNGEQPRGQGSTSPTSVTFGPFSSTQTDDRHSGLPNGDVEPLRDTGHEHFDKETSASSHGVAGTLYPMQTDDEEASDNSDAKSFPNPSNSARKKPIGSATRKALQASRPITRRKDKQTRSSPITVLGPVRVSKTTKVTGNKKQKPQQRTQMPHKVSSRQPQTPPDSQIPAAPVQPLVSSATEDTSEMASTASRDLRSKPKGGARANSMLKGSSKPQGISKSQHLNTRRSNRRKNGNWKVIGLITRCAIRWSKRSALLS